jgi:hypothetical protein
MCGRMSIWISSTPTRRRTTRAVPRLR